MLWHDEHKCLFQLKCLIRTLYYTCFASGPGAAHVLAARVLSKLTALVALFVSLSDAMPHIPCARGCAVPSPKLLSQVMEIERTPGEHTMHCQARMLAQAP